MKNKKSIASEKTIIQLMEISRKHFSLYGYENTSLEKIVEEAGMTRGALYHHFKNKKALFLAVLNEIHTEIGKYVESEAESHSDTWEQLVCGCTAFVEIAVRDDIKRILLIDAVNVIEWSEWRKKDEKNSVGLLKEQLRLLQDEKKLIEMDIDIIAHMVSGALNELSLFLVEESRPDKEYIYKAVQKLVEGFRVKIN